MDVAWKQTVKDLLELFSSGKTEVQGWKELIQLLLQAFFTNLWKTYLNTFSAMMQNKQLKMLNNKDKYELYTINKINNI